MGAPLLRLLGRVGLDRRPEDRRAMTKQQELEDAARGEGCLGRSQHVSRCLCGRDYFASKTVRFWAFDVDKAELNQIAAGVRDDARRRAERREAVIEITDSRSLVLCFGRQAMSARHLARPVGHAMDVGRRDVVSMPRM